MSKKLSKPLLVALGITGATNPAGCIFTPCLKYDPGGHHSGRIDTEDTGDDTDVSPCLTPILETSHTGVDTNETSHTATDTGLEEEQVVDKVVESGVLPEDVAALLRRRKE